jgi:aminoglycoside phosphotransferase (APT) family kinase protein
VTGERPEVPPGIDADGVGAWLAERVEGLDGPGAELRFHLVPGGHSCLTYVVDVPDGRRFVVRRPPIGHVLATAHDVLREHRIITALAATDVPVAPVVGACADPEVTGAPFYVMAFVDGVVLHDAAAAGALPAAARRQAAESLVDVLARLHAVDPDVVGLGDLSKRTEYVGRQLRRWSAQWEQSKAAEVPEMERLHAWLVTHRPPDEGPVRIAHGDFRLGNAIHGPDGAVRAMLDWELCTLGPPLADLSYLLRSWVLPGEATRSSVTPPTLAGGFPTRDELVARYVARTGADVGDLRYWTAFHAWRSACIVAGVRARYVAGVMAASTDEARRFDTAVEEGARAGLLAAGLA